MSTLAPYPSASPLFDGLEGMRQRLVTARQSLAKGYPPLAALATQHGLFSLLPLGASHVAEIRRLHGVYMAASGRINVAGLNPDTLAIFVQALDACLTGAFA